MISNVGISEVSNFIYDNFLYIGIGTSNKPELETDTELDAQVYRELSNNSVISINRPNDTVVLYKRFLNTSSYSLKESGIFDASENGKMFSRKVFPNVLTNPDDFLDVYYRVKVSDKND